LGLGTDVGGAGKFPSAEGWRAENPQKHGRTAKKPRDGVVPYSSYYYERQVKRDDEILQNQIDTNYINPRIKYVNDKWILSFGIECESTKAELNSFSVGIDLGVKELAVISYDGGKTKKIKNINKTTKVKRLKKRLKRKQRNVSRKYRTNGDYKKTAGILKEEKKVAQLHRKLANIRHDYTHQKTTEIIRMNPKKICIEDLNVAGMMKNAHLSEAIQEQTLHEFRRQIEYKAEWAGIEIVHAGRFYPSSKMCSCCGNIKTDLKLKDRIYNCEVCGLSIDRDVNAAINLEKLAG